MSAKLVIKSLLFKMAFYSGRKIIIVSSGRAGSTLLYRTLIDYYVRHYSRFYHSNQFAFWARVMSRPVMEIKDIRWYHPPVIKAHSPAPVAERLNWKYIFVFSDPSQSVMSVQKVVAERGEDWFYEHQKNLGGSGSISKLFEEDVLNYENQLKNWAFTGRSDILSIYYDDIWEREAEIQKFLDMDVQLPPKRPRAISEQQQMLDPRLEERMKNLCDRARKASNKSS